jgi:predicted transcriptional regulator of viral defense system
MDYFNFLRELKEHNLDIFTLTDAVKIIGKDRKQVASFLEYQVKRGKLFRYKKGYYSIYEIEDRFLFSLFFKDAYISLNSALEFYQIGTQQFVNLDLVTNKSRRDAKIANVSINFHKTKHFFGFAKQQLSGHEVLVASKEKLLIDCLLFANNIADINELIKEVEFDMDKLQEYLSRIDSPVLNKRIGYLFEEHGIALDLKINSKLDLLNPNIPRRGNVNRKWHLIINEAVNGQD